MTIVKPHSMIPIRECGDPLVAIPPDRFAFYNPHPYVAAGAPYDGISPWSLRARALAALTQAQQKLAALKPGWRIKLFDAFRPNRVQAYMVEREFALQAKAAGLDPMQITPAQRDALAPKVFHIWSIPSEDPATPPLHSTGGAVDCTLADAQGREVEMGSPIDENSERSAPGHFAGAGDEAGRVAHANRMLLIDLMQAEGFAAHHAEWWHFSMGDQYWAWRQREAGRQPDACAIYGRI